MGVGSFLHTDQYSSTWTRTWGTTKSHARSDLVHASLNLHCSVVREEREEIVDECSTVVVKSNRQRFNNYEMIRLQLD